MRGIHGLLQTGNPPRFGEKRCECLRHEVYRYAFFQGSRIRGNLKPKLSDDDVSTLVGLMRTGAGPVGFGLKWGRVLL